MGDHDRAMALYDEGRFAEAAELEEKALRAVPADRPRTLGIICMSAVSMWLRAGDRDRARAMHEEFRARLLPGFNVEIDTALAGHWKGWGKSVEDDNG